MSGKDTIRILFLLPTYTFGGAERTSLNLLGGIDKKRFRICLVTSRNIFTYFRHIDIEKFIPLEDIGIDTWYTTYSRFFRDVGRVASLLEQEAPDLAFGMMHYPSSLLVFAKKWRRLSVKVIASPRGPSTEYLRHFENRLLRTLFLKWIFTFFCKHAEGLVVASHGMKEECIRDYSGDPEKITVIPNSIDSDDILKRYEEPTGIEVQPGYLLLSSSGRVEREKNMSFLLKSFAAVKKQAAIRLIIIGDGTERENLMSFAKTLNIEGDVIFTGHQSNPYKFIKKSDIYVHTCLFEGFANSIIEAMACGVPVLATDCPYGPRDIIQDGENGFLIPVNDEEAMVHALLKLVNDRALRERIGAGGVERATVFSVPKMVAGYETFFNNIAQIR